jgi:hypothetical protein
MVALTLNTELEASFGNGSLQDYAHTTTIATWRLRLMKRGELVNPQRSRVGNEAGSTHHYDARCSK